jgi:hypothetical protein
VNVHVHIDRLVLDGLPLTHRERERLHAGVEQELARLLGTTSGEWPSAATAVRRIATPMIAPHAGAPVQRWGGAIATAVRDGIGKAVTP